MPASDAGSTPLAAIQICSTARMIQPVPCSVCAQCSAALVPPARLLKPAAAPTIPVRITQATSRARMIRNGIARLLAGRGGNQPPGLAGLQQRVPQQSHVVQTIAGGCVEHAQPIGDATAKVD